MIAALTTLPTELLYEITEQLDRQSLLHCARTCQLLAKIIAAKLWKVIPRLTPQKTLQLIRALSTSPNAGTVVLEISINGSSAIQLQSTPSTPRPPTVHEIIAHGLGGLFQFSKSQSYTPTVSTPGASELSIQTFSTAFQKMINLRKLVIHSWACSSKLWGFTLFIPTLCEVFVYREAESIELLGWIKGQSNLTRLRLWVPQRWQDGGSFLLNKPTISFPHLQSLTTTPRGAIILLQCSSVSDLIIENIVNLPKRTINTHELAKAIVQKSISGVLKRLTLDGRDSDVLGLLVLLQGRLPNLHSLRIVFSGRIHGTFNLPSGPANDYTRSMASFLRSTPTLERFEVWIGYHSPHFPDPELRVPQSESIIRTEGVLVREWAKICPRLEVVRFPTNTKWLVDRLKGGPVPRLVYPAW